MHFQNSLFKFYILELQSFQSIHLKIGKDLDRRLLIQYVVELFQFKIQNRMWFIEVLKILGFLNLYILNKIVLILKALQ